MSPSSTPPRLTSLSHGGGCGCKIAPAVLTELLSDPKLPASVATTLSEIPAADVRSGYWRRAGELRAKVFAKRRKARLGDALIAQSCIDERVFLLTRDRDFVAFAEAASLYLLLEPGTN